MVPDEFALHLRHLYVMVVQFADDVLHIVLLELSEFLCHVDALHFSSRMMSPIILLDGRAATWSDSADLGSAFIEYAAGGVCGGGFRVQPQHRLRARTPDHHPARIAQVELDAVEVFTADDGITEIAGEFGAGKIR